MSEARRTVLIVDDEAPLRRVLEATAIEDATGSVDVWLRVRSPDGRLVGQLHTKPIALRAIADLLASLAAELGVEP